MKTTNRTSVPKSVPEFFLPSWEGIKRLKNYNYWCHIKILCIRNICYKYEISKLPIFEENNILVFLRV